MQYQRSLYCERTVFDLICFCPRINLDCIQAEASALSKRLRDTEKKVLSSVQDVQDQFLSIIKVSRILYNECIYIKGFILSFNHTQSY